MTDKCSFSVDNELIIRSWSDGMERLSRRKAEEFIGRRMGDYFPLLERGAAAVFGSGRKKVMKDIRSTCLMGTDLAVDVQAVPVGNNNGRVTEVALIFDNVAGECPLERQLADSEKMVAIGRIASSLAHGVRNPLNAIKGAVVYLRKKYGHEPTLLEFSTIINEEIEKLDGFISGFLSASKGDMSIAPLDLTGVIMSILAMIRPRAAIQGVKLSHDLQPLPPVTADAFQVEQALFNIINNSLEAMQDGGEMCIKTSLSWERDIDYAVVEISDTGKGIPENRLQRLGQLSGGPGRSDRGFGIFLSREVIKSCNGKLLWESSRERGTTFRVSLPVRLDDYGR